VKSSDLILYVLPGCGYCEDVRVALRDLGVEVPERSVSEPEHRDALVAARGRKTTPVLRIGDDRWMGESRDIIDYLYERFGEAGQRPPIDVGRWLQPLTWVLLLAGGLASEPWQSVLWTVACAVAAGRSAFCAMRTGAWIHAAVGAAFAFGAVSIALHALEVVDLPWWYAAFAVAAVALGGVLMRQARA